MEQITELFGHGKSLTILQMSCRGILAFLITLILIRISGRRSFGMRTPLDNIIVLLLGAMLSRAVAGASPFWPAVATSFVLVLLHRLIGWAMMHNQALSELIEGKKLLLYENSEFKKDSVHKAIVSKQDILQGTRKVALTDDLNKIDKIYMEVSGEISVIKTNNSN